MRKCLSEKCNESRHSFFMYSIVSWFKKKGGKETPFIIINWFSALVIGAEGCMFSVEEYTVRCQSGGAMAELA